MKSICCKMKVWCIKHMKRKKEESEDSKTSPIRNLSLSRNGSIGKETLILTTSKFIVVLISLVTTMLLSRFRTLEEYGTYSQILISINLVTTLFILGFPNSINYFLGQAESNKDKRTFLSVYYTSMTLLSFISGIVLVICSPFIEQYFENPLIKNFIYVLALLPWAKISLASVEHILVALRKTRYLMKFRILHSFMLIFIVLIVEFLSLGFREYMLMFIIVELVFSVITYIIASNIIGKLNISFDAKMLKRILQFSIPIGVASLVGVLSLELDKLVIGKYFSTSEIAIYTNAAKELPITIIATSFTAVLMPRLVKLLKKGQLIESVKLWGISIKLSYIAISFFASTLIVFAPEVITILYSTKYLAGVSVFRVYNLVLLFRITYFGIILNSMGRTKFVFYSSIVSLGANLILNLIFLKIFGFIGPAIATLIAVGLVALFQIIATTKVTGIPFKNIFPWRDLVYITGYNIGFSILFLTLKTVSNISEIVGDTLEAVILGIVWMIIYFFILRKIIKANLYQLNSKEYE